MMVLFFQLFSWSSAMGQTYYNYASAYVDLQMNQYHAIIRNVSSSSALVSYYDYTFGRNIIALIDLSMNIKKIMLKERYTVYDMRITGDNVYFCGTVNDGGKAFIGHLKLSSFNNPTSRPTTYYVINNHTSKLTRLVAYDIGGKQKVVAVGKHHFITGGAFTCPYDPVTNPYTCMCYFIVEADFQDNHLMSSFVQYLPTNNTSHDEDITEVIETPNYVALVGHYYNENAPVIHRCNKSNVLLSFQSDPFYYYPAVPNEGHSDYHGCVMNGDTIAMASLSSYIDGAGITQFSTNVRVFDLVSMNNTEAQMLPLNTKTEPYDFVYMLEKGRLVLLQDICLPPHPCDQNMFIHLEPYATAPYAAKCWYESGGAKPFYSLDRLSGGYYLAAGGQYWCLKELMSIIPSACYKNDNIIIDIINLLPKTKCIYTYNLLTEPTLSDSENFFGNDIINSLCVTP